MLRILLAVGLSVVVAGSALAAEGASTRGKGDKEAMKHIGAASKANDAKDWDNVIANADKALAVEKVGTALLYVAHQLRAVGHLQKDPKNACKTILPDLQYVTAGDQMVYAEKPDAEKQAKAAEFLSLQGKCMNDLKVGDRGLAAYTTAIAWDPQNWAFYQGRCFVYYQSDKNKEAIEDCTKAAALNQTETQSLKVIGSAEHKLGHKKEALEAWQAVLEIDPNDAMAKKNVEGLKKEVGTQ
jgi:tetratricopeptide (TPR) repeat protein